MRDSHSLPRASIRSRVAVAVFAIGVALLCLFCLTAPAQAQGFSRDINRVSTWTDVELQLEFRALRRGIDSLARRQRVLERSRDSLILALFQLERQVDQLRPDTARPAPPVLPETARGKRFRDAARRAAERTNAELGAPLLPLPTGAPTYREMHGYLATGDDFKARIIVLVTPPLGYLAGRLQHDPGGYADSWRFVHDKQAHFASSVVVGAVTGAVVGNAWGFTACVAAGAALELGQSYGGGYFSGRDLAYDAAGCAGGLLVKELVAALERT